MTMKAIAVLVAALFLFAGAVNVADGHERASAKTTMTPAAVHVAPMMCCSADPNGANDDYLVKVLKQKRVATACSESIATNGADHCLEIRSGEEYRVRHENSRLYILNRQLVI